MKEYNAQIIRVVNGDTLDLEVNLGFNVLYRSRFYLLGVECEDKSTENGFKSFSFLKEFEGQNIKILVRNECDENTFNFIDVIVTKDNKEINVNEFFILSGYGTRRVKNNNKKENRRQTEYDYKN